MLLEKEAHMLGSGAGLDGISDEKKTIHASTGRKMFRIWPRRTLKEQLSET